MTNPEEGRKWFSRSAASITNIHLEEHPLPQNQYWSVLQKSSSLRK